MRGREGVARRYAKALVELAAEGREYDALGAELEQFHGLFLEQAELRGFLARPWVKGSEKAPVLEAVTQRMGLSELARRFLGVVAGRNRLDHLGEILVAYRRLADEAQGRARIAVQTAVPLTDAEREALKEKLGRVTGKQVILDESLDARLISGIRAQIGSLVLDASLKGHLSSLRERLVRG